jgi:hypothetical protein
MRLISKSQLDGKIAPIHRFRSDGAGRGILKPTALDDPLRPSTDIVSEGALQVADAHCAKAAT